MDTSELSGSNEYSKQILDPKFLRLWCAWEDAFPCKKFNKYHGAFCCNRHFVHYFNMAGQVSEGSNKAYNATMANVKKIIECMHLHKQQIKKITQRSQGNLKSKWRAGLKSKTDASTVHMADMQQGHGTEIILLSWLFQVLYKKVMVKDM